MKTKAWILLSAILVFSCTEDNDGDPALPPAPSFEATIETFAGNGVFGHAGDGGPAKSAKLGWVQGISIDPNDNVYIADGGNNVVRKVNASNTISTLAGKIVPFSPTDMEWYTGDGGPATAARLNAPLWAAADASGNVFITDAGNFVLRKVNAAGVISTFAGGRVMGYGGDNGPALEAKFDNPYGLATDAAGNVYVADRENHIIRKISTDGKITTIAGTPGQGGYSGDNGPATAAKLRSPLCVAVDSEGSIYISDNNSVIRKITNGTITTIAGTGVKGFSGDGGKATEAQLSVPKGIAVGNDGSVVFGDVGNDRIRRIKPGSGIIETIAGTGEHRSFGDGGPAHLAGIMIPAGLAMDSKGNIYVAEEGSASIRIIKPVK